MMSCMLKLVRKRLFPNWNDEWPALMERARSCKSMQLGCGIGTKLSGCINVDINLDTNPDVVHDLNVIPYPFEDNSFDMIVAISILEHLSDFFAVMEEVHRISRDGATVHILVPHFSSAAAYVDPTHCQLLSARSCDYFIEGTVIESDYGFYMPYRFRLKKRYIELAGLWRYFPPLRWLVKNHTAFWEGHLCFIFRGAGVYWELEVVKD